jgi:Zn-dependent protease with chaperone function
MSEAAAENPIAAMDLDFGAYLEARRQELAAHTAAGGVADYAFGLDHALRQRIAAIAPARHLVQMLGATAGPIQKHIHRIEMIAVGPRQFPEIHALGESCARRLGIGIPQIFIAPTQELAAYTFASDDIAPTVVLSAGLIDALEPKQLLFVIGHECGHIHNLHGAYNTAVQNLTNPLAKSILDKVAGLDVALELVTSVSHIRLIASAVTGALKMFFLNWSRSAEVTCDRTGLICCGSLETAERALASLATGGVASLRGINIDAYLDQLNQTRSSPLRLLELSRTHPLIPKRIEALRAFAGCDVLYGWRSDIARPPALQTKADIDSRCARILGILSAGELPKLPATAG